ncbi:MAG TPA: glycosyltransferase [Roseomonas sp.]
MAPPLPSLARAAEALEAGDAAAAIRHARAALKREPANLVALKLRTQALLLSGDAAEAARQAMRITRREPGDAHNHNMLGQALAAAGDHAAALAAFAQVPDFPDAATESFARGARFSPEDPVFPAQLGNLLVTARRHAEALAPLQRALQLRPDDVATLIDAGMALGAGERWPEALVLLDHAATLAPDDIVVRLNRADALLHLRRFADAEADYAQARRLRPGDADATIGLLHTHQQLAVWDGIEALALDAIALGGALLPLSLLAATDDPAAALRATREWARAEMQHRPPAPALAMRHDDGPLRIAYVSPDFGDHPVGILVAGLIEAHDRTRFETIGVGIGPVHRGALHDRLRAGFGRFIDARAMTDDALAGILRAAEVDIAVDLGGFTFHTRPRLFARRVAPIQFNFLGISASMGTDCHDYIVVDPVVVPPGSEAQFDEQVLRLPHCYMPTDRARAIGQAGPRAAYGLRADAFVFAAFNAAHKITPEVFSAWCRLLQAVPGSQLWLSHPPAETRANLLREAAARGIAAERIVFADRVDYPEHLARTALADLALDTFPYTGATTACDALWAGLPMVTRAGRSFNARVAASLLHAIGLPELVTDTLAGYEALALALARDPARLRTVRDRLAANRLTTPLFDTAGYTGALEAAFTQAAGRARAGLPPAPIG